MGVRHFGDLSYPGPRGVDHDVAVDVVAFPVGAVPDLHTGYVTAPVEEHVHNVGEQVEDRAVLLGAGREGEGQPQGVKSAVRNYQGGQQFGVEVRFQTQGFLRCDFIHRDTAGFAALDESFLVGQVVFGDGDEQSPVRLDDVGDDFSQDDVFLDALDSGFLVLDSVTSAAVQQAVGASGCAVGNRAAFHDGDIETAQGQVVGDGCAREPCADDDSMRFAHGGLLLLVKNACRAFTTSRAPSG